MKIALYKATRPGIQGLFNILVRWWCNGPYSHSELVIEERNGFALCGSASWLDGGVRLKWIKLNPAHWDLLPVSGDPVAARAWFEAHAGQGYDLLGLLGHVWRRGDGSRRRWLCSEACAAALGWPEPWRFDPNGLAAVGRIVGAGYSENCAASY